MDVEALRQAADRLLRDGVKRRQCQVLLRNSLVEQGLDVGLRVNAAAARYLVDRLPARGELVELLDRHLQKRGHLVDEGARAAGARAVHAHVGHGGGARLLVALEEHHLRVLAAELDRAAHVLVVAAHGKRVRNDFLHEGHAEGVGDGSAARSARHQAKRALGEFFCHRAQEGGDRFHLMRVVTHVAREEHALREWVEHHGFRGGGSDVDSQMVSASYH